ncbi:hypothetical protein [uncultured Acinetobacter sp.]|uniref:hypothetical protein n=1 Tax=uncultured Acinetobacter sp. TaxID=165433 RepID=UPI0025DEB035|nr:hypothetical protein [uncultured Acinetobacter sp.]
MNQIKYVIRHNHFAYNDEWYQTDQATLGAIKAIYTDKDEAMKAYKTLIAHDLYQLELYDYDIFGGYETDGLSQTMEKFILEKTGQEFDEITLPEMNEQDAFEFAQLSGLLRYQLLELDETRPNFVIWLPTEQRYFSDFHTGDIIFSAVENFVEGHESEWYFLKQLNITLQGSLAMLSDSPELLNNFIQNQQGIRYNETKLSLTIDTDVVGYNTLNGLNALLKQPLFEIKQASLEELKNLQENNAM